MENQPTQEQIKEFWEWCGFSQQNYGKKKSGGKYHNEVWETEVDDIRWISPGNFDCGFYLPSVDINNIFKYASPKLTNIKLSKTDTNEYFVAVVTEYNPLEKESKAFNRDPALALFWAIWKVIHNERNLILLL